MYMPRLRARQHEIFAVRNCAASFANSNQVVPILEPVKTPNDLLARRLADIAAQGASCDLVLNPSVGDMRGRDEWRALGDFYLAHNLLDNHSLAILSNADADHQSMAEWLANAKRDGASFAVDIVHELDLSVSLRGTTYHGVRWNIAEDRTVPSAYGLPLGGRPVVWANDPFPALPRNREYVGRAEGIFSTRATAFRSAGYLGISDFLTIGRRFESGGGPAYAVVIHLTYELAGVVRLKHFCSDSNDTQDDPGGKFLEALDKLVAFVQVARLPTNLGIDGLLDLHQRQHFPGLGKAKELAMMNHMLVMQAAVSS